MVWVCVPKDGGEQIHQEQPRRKWKSIWISEEEMVYLPKGSIKKLIGRELDWNSEPVELK